MMTRPGVQALCLYPAETGGGTAAQHELAVGQGNSEPLRPLAESGIKILSLSEPVSLLPCR